MDKFNVLPAFHISSLSNKIIQDKKTPTIQLIPSQLQQSEKRLCTITKIDISNQKERSNFLSENSIYQLFLNDKETYLNLEHEYLSNLKRKLPIKNKCYYIAHNIRNFDSNKRNNLKRKINKYDNKETLFNMMELVQLNYKQKKIFFVNQPPELLEAEVKIGELMKLIPNAKNQYAGDTRVGCTTKTEKL